MWGSLLIVTTLLAVKEGVRLYPCGDAGYQDVEENTPLTFYCDQYTGSATWRYQTPASNSFAVISSCDDTGCGRTLSLWTLTYISAGNSSLTITRTSRTPNQAGGQYKCENEECGLHVIVPAVVSQPTSPVINRQDSGYTLSASVNVTRVYSSRGNYSCLWQLGSSRHTTTPDLSPPAADTSNTADRTGRCDVTMSLPDTSGTYPCSVTVTPGNTQTSCGSLTITRPSPPTISCPSDFIAENTPLTCTCNTANIGQPGGRLRWFTGTGSDISTEVISGAYNVSTLGMTWTVRRGDDNNRKFRCVNNWTVNVTAQSNTTRVAYGPDTVSIQGNTPFYTDTTGSQRMTLTCQAGGVNPSSALTYNWDVLCDGRQQSTCIFKPRPGPSGDDNTVITCTVTNTKNNNNTQHNSVTLDIKYPPLSAPNISSYVNGRVLYEGDSLTLTCAVTGGDPVVNSTTLTCPGRHLQNPTPGQSSSLVISRLSGSDHNLTCVCSGQWVRESYYTLTDTRTLTVYYPPSTPTITRTDGKSRAALEGDTVSLTCSLTSFGHPSAERTWVSERSNAKDPLLLGKVVRGYNNRTVTCQASNNFTQLKEQQLIGTFILQVYYSPNITVQPRVNNSCTMTSDGMSCQVTEGQGVHLQCKADSNPAPQDCTWRFLSGSGIVLDTGTNLDLVSANRTDSGVYQVEVKTTKPDVTDDRLPLTARSNLTVLVTYPPTNARLTVNNNINITVNEKEAVTLTCQSRGRPTPRLELLQRDVQLARQDGGQLSLSEEITHLSHHTAARCNNTGTLTCRADNGVGSVQNISVQLYVNCKPRQTTAAPAPPNINFINTTVSTAFYLQAFPLPDSFMFQYLGTTHSSSSKQPVPDSIELTARCINTVAAFAVQCNISVNSAKDSTAEGFYTFTAANAFGQEQFVFQVTVNASGSGATDGNAVAIGSGIAAGLVVIGVIVLVCYCCRRQKKNKESKQRSGKTTQFVCRENADRCQTAPDDQERIIVNTIYDSSDNALDQERIIVNTIYDSSDNALDQERVIVNTIYESSDNAVRQAASPYEDVETEPGRNPTIVPEPQPGPSGAGDDNTYAVVNKARKTSTPVAAAAAAAPGDDGANVYAVVDKKTKAPALPPPPAEAGPPRTTRPTPAPKPMAGKGGRQEEAAEAEYGNIATAARPTAQGEGTVYENYAFQPDGDEAAAAALPKAASGGQGTGRRNADGLNYTTVVFTEEQQEKANNPVTPLDKTNYASLNFTSMAKNAKKKAKK